jgi:hypothetical protein
MTTVANNNSNKFYFTTTTVNSSSPIINNKPYYLRPNELQTKMNKKMTELIPELDSEYAITPMSNGKWRHPKDVLDDESPCFIPFDIQEVAEHNKQDYIWMPKGKLKDGTILPAGYYHLRTQEAYIEINRRMCQMKPHSSNILFKSEAEKEDQDIYNKLVDLMDLRLHCNEPSDIYAMRMRVLGYRRRFPGEIIGIPGFKKTAKVGFHN